MVTDEAELFWERHYRTPRAWDGRANPLLVEVAGPLPPGVALDLGCGAGGDTVWLALRGWQVTAVDIAGAAVDQVRAAAERAGVGERVVAQRHDLGRTSPAGAFDLVSAQYLQTPFALPRADVLRTAARALRPGGLLLVVDHGSTAPWSWHQDPEACFPTPEEVAAGLELDPGEWRIVRADRPRREAVGPSGQTATVTDNVLLIQRGSA
jgi:SAM-dependent methyltransferase